MAMNQEMEALCKKLTAAYIWMNAGTSALALWDRKHCWSQLGVKMHLHNDSRSQQFQSVATMATYSPVTSHMDIFSSGSFIIRGRESSKHVPI
jgi:hypothetical protein